MVLALLLIAQKKRACLTLEEVAWIKERWHDVNRLKVGHLFLSYDMFVVGSVKEAMSGNAEPLAMFPPAWHFMAKNTPFSTNKVTRCLNNWPSICIQEWVTLWKSFLKYFTFVHCKRKHTPVHPEEIGRPFVFRGGSHFAGPGQMTLSCLQLNCAVKPWSHTSAFPLSLKRNLLPPKGVTTNIPKINSRRESLGKRYRINRNRKCKLRKP